MNNIWNMIALVVLMVLSVSCAFFSGSQPAVVREKPVVTKEATPKQEEKREVVIKAHISGCVDWYLKCEQAFSDLSKGSVGSPVNFIIASEFCRTASVECEEFEYGDDSMYYQASSELLSGKFSDAERSYYKLLTKYQSSPYHREGMPSRMYMILQCATRDELKMFQQANLNEIFGQYAAASKLYKTLSGRGCAALQLYCSEVLKAY
ncbi:MAG: tol-pal system YbgF family protein [Desulfovibrionaceae bacterium]